MRRCTRYSCHQGEKLDDRWRLPPAGLAPFAVAQPEVDFRLSRASSPRASPVACAVWRPPCHASRRGAHPLRSGSSTRVAR